jgi:two-component system NtrC family sensor kinase
MNPRQPSVLVVDDVEANLVAISAVLDGMGCQVVQARSGNEALRVLLKQKFVAILLDVQMPQMDGYEVATHVRSHTATKDIPILFLTAKHDTEDDVLRGYGTGAVDFLSKPVSPVILRSKVRVFLDLHEGRNKVERALSELQVAQSQLVQSAKMAALGELVAGVAHEINNPLAFVTSHLATARQSLDLVEAAAQASPNPEVRAAFDKASVRLREMTAGLGRIADLVQQLRTFSRLDEGERKTIDVRECIDAVLMLLGHRFGERIEVKLELTGPEQLDCYPGPLNLALLNLMGNAIDAIDDRGTIVISTATSQDWFRLSVEDDGIGIPVELKERVIEPFFTTKPVGKGTGLGLSITYSIAKRHGGHLEIESKPGHGTTMTIAFPLDLGMRD